MEWFNALLPEDKRTLISREHFEVFFAQGCVHKFQKILLGFAKKIANFSKSNFADFCKHLTNICKKIEIAEL